VRFYEALSRLRTEDGRIIMPSQYIKIAEPAGLMSIIDNMLLFRCVQALQTWGQRNREIGVFINLSRETLQDRGFFSQFIEYLEKHRELAGMLVFEISQEIFETLANRSFIALFISAIFGAVASGLSAALAFYFYTYFWGFTTQQSGFVTMGVFVSAIIGATLAPIISRTIGKKKGAIIIGLIAFLGSPVPIVLRLAHILPGNDSPAIFWIVFFTTMFDVGLIICFQILSGAMMGDLVEQAELKTGRRSEGIFFAASAFIRKVVGGLGLITATMVLTMAGLPAGADPTQVSPETVWKLGAYYVPTILSLWLAMLAVMSAYTLTRTGHEDNLRKLAEARKPT
jgi:Na+/melibiose symporter-like transporter